VLRKISGFKRENGIEGMRRSRDLVLLDKYYEDELGRG
jgi:hypothetical protein